MPVFVRVVVLVAQACVVRVLVTVRPLVVGVPVPCAA